MINVLIVSRDISDQNSLTEQLKKEGYLAKIEADNELALKTFSAIEPYVVIIDSSISSESRDLLRKSFKRIKPRINILEINARFALDHLKRVFPE